VNNPLFDHLNDGAVLTRKLPPEAPSKTSAGMVGLPEMRKPHHEKSMFQAAALLD
jgi:hypothetical protein